MTTQLRNVTDELTDRLAAMGVPLPLALKRRDPKEPGRRKKEQTERDIQAAFERYFARQKSEIRQAMMRVSPERKTMFGYDADYYLSHMDEVWDNQDFIAKLARILVAASANGIDIFADLMPLQIDYTLVNEAAAKWALEYAGEMVTKIDATTLKTLRAAMSDFVSTPGMTIGDIMNRLPYKESRSRLIAINETTDTYANADRMAGEALQKEYPEVLVVKQAFTNRDDKVCPICLPFNAKVVPIDEPFVHPDTGEQYDGPKFHIGCRCWRSTTTRIDGIISPEEYGGAK